MTDATTRALLEQALEALSCDGGNDDPGHRCSHCDDYVDRNGSVRSALRAELAKPADIAVEMSAVADQFAHKLALDLECVLADYSGTWYDTAINTLSAYREAMNAIHERESPTFMGEPVLRSELGKPSDKTATQAQHDAPDVAALKAELLKDSKRLNYLQKYARCDPKMDGKHMWWPTTFNQAQNLRGETLREAIDAAIAKAEGGAA